MKSKRVFSIAALISVSVTGLAIALYSQIELGAKPCAWCILQRIAYVCLLALGFTALIFNAFTFHRTSRFFSASGCFVSLFGLWSAYEQIQSVRRMNDCGISIANKWLLDWGLDDVSKTFFQVKASCSDAAFSIGNIPMENLSVVGFLFCLICCIASALTKRR